MNFARQAAGTTGIASTSQRVLSARFSVCAPRLAAHTRARDPNKTPLREKTHKPLAKHLPRTELHLALCNTTAITARPVLIHETSCRQLVRAWGIDKMPNVTIIEPYAGPGGLTRALLELPNVKKVIAIEQAVRYLPLLETLKEREGGDRLHIISADPYSWEAYTEIIDKGLLDDVEKVSWDQVHPSLFMVSTLPNHRHGEQIFVQWANCTAGKMWLYQWGRFGMGIVANRGYWTKLSAAPSTAFHHKLAVLMESLLEIKPIESDSISFLSLSPADLHFHHPRGDAANFSAVTVVPRIVPLVQEYEALEFITRNMFVTKGHPWRKALSAVAPGASNLLAKIEADPVMNKDPKWAVNDLSMEEWAVIARVFMKWPFRPNVLFTDGGHAGFSEV